MCVHLGMMEGRARASQSRVIGSIALYDAMLPIFHNLLLLTLDCDVEFLAGVDAPASSVDPWFRGGRGGL